MLEGLSTHTRKISAAMGGNITALSENLQTWSEAILKDFINDTSNQLNALNVTLDQLISLIQVFSTSALNTESVVLWDLLGEVISEYREINIHLPGSDGQYDIRDQVYIDRTLTKQALEFLLEEIAKRTLPGQLIDIEITKDDEFLIVSIESSGTLPLPGLKPEPEEIQNEDLDPSLYLAQKLFLAQGGDVTFQKVLDDSGEGICFIVRLPAVANRDEIHRFKPPEKQNLAKDSRILLAESQPEYQLSVRDALIQNGYRVDLAGNGNAVLDLVQRTNPDLVIVGRNLVGLDGILVTQGIRRWSAVPIIMVSSRINPDDLIYAYQVGVDDYIRKPFLNDELLMRIQSCLKRSQSTRISVNPEIYHSGSLRINYTTRQVWARGEPVDLTPIEYNLLVYMSRQGKQIMTYEKLLERVWEGPDKGTRQGLFVHIRRLRNKIEVDPKNPDIICNKWGVGYVFNP